MKVRTILSVPILLLLLFAIVISARAQTDNLRTKPYVSLWQDYRTVAPAGWTVSNNDSQAKDPGGFTEVNLAPYDPSYRFVIRWYKRYSTHKLPDGALEMYGSFDQFVEFSSRWYGENYLVERPHEVSVAGQKAQRFIGRLVNIPLTTRDDEVTEIVLNRRTKLGSVVDDSVVRKGGKQAWTVVPAPSGFYVLAYFAPDEGFAKYEVAYNEMVASFVLLKDGPDGSPIPGSSAPVETPGELPSTPQEILAQCLADLRELQGKNGGIDLTGVWRFQSEKDIHLEFEVRTNQLVASLVNDNQELAQDYGRVMPFFTATLDGRRFTGIMSNSRFKGSTVSGSIDEHDRKIEWTLPECGSKDSVAREGQSLWPKSVIALRNKIIQLVSTMQPPPAIPENAIRLFIEGNAFVKAARNATDYRVAIDKYQDTLAEAPWWGVAYNNLGVALEAAGRTQDAKVALQFYLLTKPADADKAQKKIYEIGAQEQLKEEHMRQEQDRQSQCRLEIRAGSEALNKGSSGYADAIQHYKKASELCSDPLMSAAAYARAGDVYRRQSNLDDAYKYMQKAFELDPNPQPDERWRYANFGKILELRGDRAGGCRYWRLGCTGGSKVSCGNLGGCP